MCTLSRMSPGPNKPRLFYPSILLPPYMSEETRTQTPTVTGESVRLSGDSDGELFIVSLRSESSPSQVLTTTSSRAAHWALRLPGTTLYLPCSGWYHPDFVFRSSVASSRSSPIRLKLAILENPGPFCKAVVVPTEPGDTRVPRTHVLA